MTMDNSFGLLPPELAEDTDDAPVPSDRETTLDNVVRDRLTAAVGAEDDETAEAIDAASKSVAVWVDKLVTDIERDFGEISRGSEPLPDKKGTYRVKRDHVGPYYIIKEEKVKSITTDVEPKKPEPLKQNDMKRWAEWTNDVASVAEKWAGWIGKTCNLLEDKTSLQKKGKGGMKKDEWEKLKNNTRNNAIEWSKNKKLLKKAAKLWQNKSCAK